MKRHMHTAGTWKQSTEGMLIASISMSCGIDSLMSMAVLALNKPGIFVLSGAGEGVVTHATLIHADTPSDTLHKVSDTHLIHVSATHPRPRLIRT